MKPTRARYWVVVFALALAVVMYIQRVAISAAAPFITAEFYLSDTHMGWALSVFGLSLLEIPGVPDVRWTMALMALASFSSDLTMPISWNTCVEIGKQYTATVASTMNILGNLAGCANCSAASSGSHQSQLEHGALHHGRRGFRLGRLLALPRARRQALISIPIEKV